MITSIATKHAVRAVHAAGSPLLVLAKVHDDAIGYHTTILEALGAGILLLSFHEASLLLDSVRLRGEYEALVMTSEGTWYTGCLRPHQTMNSCLVLEMFEAQVMEHAEHYLLPQT